MKKIPHLLYFLSVFLTILIYFFSKIGLIRGICLFYSSIYTILFGYSFIYRILNRKIFLDNIDDKEKNKFIRNTIIDGLFFLVFFILSIVSMIQGWGYEIAEFD